jgi:signal-transduction protein with cAMP-binding, CBS, and nucleotidyltransferase domain
MIQPDASNEPSVHRLADLQTRPLIVASPRHSVLETLERARRDDVHHLPVVEGERLVGITCTCDLADAPLDARVEQVMKRSPTTLGSDRSGLDAATLMKQSGVGSVIVLDGQRAVGIVTRRDLLAGAEHAARALLQDICCECCASREHLRPYGANRTLCKDCRDRAGNSDSSWVDIGDSA